MSGYGSKLGTSMVNIKHALIKMISPQVSNFDQYITWWVSWIFGRYIFARIQYGGFLDTRGTANHGRHG